VKISPDAATMREKFFTGATRRMISQAQGLQAWLKLADQQGGIYLTRR
jgi:hypothetical protein